jgi:quercetin dioxygenase-like cupin family protein
MAATIPGTTVTYSEDLKWEPVGPLDENGKGIFVSPVYGELQSKGPTYFLMKYSGGVRAPRHMHSGDYYAVVVSGRFRHYLESENECDVLASGSTWFQKGNVVHQDFCVGPEDCILGIFWPQGFDVEFAEEK